MLGYLIEKEFKQIKRDWILPKLIFVFPFIALILLPYAANFDIKDIRVVVVDNDKSSQSNLILNKFRANTSLNINYIEDTYSEAMELIHEDRADMIIDIPLGFEKDYIVNKNANILIAVNTVNGMKGSISAMYAQNIISDFSIEKNSSLQVINSLTMEILPLYAFNKTLNYKFFMVPALMVMILALICGFLPAFNIVGEKEKGNMEQINVTPITKPVFILSKLIPYWIIGAIVMSIGFLVAWLFYGIKPEGSIFTVYIFSFIFTLAISGFGLVLSNYAQTYQQAVFMMFFFIMIMILMSGLYTPFTSMPPWAQTIGSFSPLKYFIDIMRCVYLKGSKFTELLPQLYSLLGFVIVTNTWAILSYRKKN